MAKVAGESGGKKEVLVNPEGWDDIVEKYREREEEQVKRLQEKRGVSTPEELVSVAADTLAKRALRAEHQTLKDRQILRNAKSDEVEALRKQLNAEITEFASYVVKQMPSLKGHPALKGRVTVGSPDEKFTGAAGG